MKSELDINLRLEKLEKIQEKVLYDEVFNSGFLAGIFGVLIVGLLIYSIILICNLLI